ncbi:hypothetical protein [Caldifermentibacillus hisashii]|uniref:hypothetical protein n=1 Tax=Caldifermentibacillus hisashii TaxID=996558 RepID=UPI0030EA9C14
MQRIFVFAGNYGDGKEYRGYFDGENFCPKLGFCKSLEHLTEFDFVELYGMDGLLCATPTSLCSDIAGLMRSQFQKEFGESKRGRR